MSDQELINMDVPVIAAARDTVRTALQVPDTDQPKIEGGADVERWIDRTQAKVKLAALDVLIEENYLMRTLAYTRPKVMHHLKYSASCA